MFQKKVQEVFVFILSCHLHVEVLPDCMSKHQVLASNLTVSQQLHSSIFFRSLENIQSVN